MIKRGSTTPGRATRQDTDAGERVVLPYLRSRGIEALDGMIVSHLDQDHSGGAAAVLRGIEVRPVLSSIPPRHAGLGGREAVERCVAGQHSPVRRDALRVLHPRSRTMSVGYRPMR